MSTVDDVAKRLVDYGFHAPTMSFPVAGTLMVEPTESEDLAEIDRFIEAMIAIKAEADAVAAGAWPADDNPLVHAPHTAQSVIEGEWDHAYTREQAVYPVRVARAARSTGRRCAASTTRSATATWSAPARRSRRSPTDAASAPPSPARAVARVPPSGAVAGPVETPVSAGIREIPRQQLEFRRPSAAGVARAAAPCARPARSGACGEVPETPATTADSGLARNNWSLGVLWAQDAPAQAAGRPNSSGNVAAAHGYPTKITASRAACATTSGSSRPKRL